MPMLTPAQEEPQEEPGPCGLGRVSRPTRTTVGFMSCCSPGRRSCSLFWSRRLRCLLYQKRHNWHMSSLPPAVTFGGIHSKTSLNHHHLHHLHCKPRPLHAGLKQLPGVQLPGPSQTSFSSQLLQDRASSLAAQAWLRRRLRPTKNNIRQTYSNCP